jgi:hypothetical protein
MRYTSAALIISALLALLQASEAREFGPEWTKVANDEERAVHHKRLEVPVVHFGGNVANYDVKLESDRLQIVEIDDNQGYWVENLQYGRFEVHKKADRTAAWYCIRFIGVQYYDLNGDGVLDAMVDWRQQHMRAFILVDDRFIEVDENVLPETRAAKARNVRYVFEDGKWRIHN